MPNQLTPTPGIPAATPAYGRSMFQDVSLMNEVFGNRKGNANGDPEEFDWGKLEKQISNIPVEFKELQKAVDEGDYNEIRDALCDIMVFTLGAFHLMGADADMDMKRVFLSNMSKLCSTREELDETLRKYRDLGLNVYEEGRLPYACVKSGTDQTHPNGDFLPKGKFLKGVKYHPPCWEEEPTLFGSMANLQ